MFRLQRKGGERVGKGTYWDVSNGERIRMERPGRLPGDDSRGYLRFHPLALLVVGPILGLVYAIFMPLVAILMVFWVLGGRILSAFSGWLARVSGLDARRSARQKAPAGPSEPVAGRFPVAKDAPSEEFPKEGSGGQ